MSLPRYSVNNPVLVGVVMWGLIGGGLYAGSTLVREMFPESRPNAISIITPYPGATPEEVERGISKRIEEAIKNIEYIDKIDTNISEGLSTIMVELTSEVKDLDQKVNEFEIVVDSIPRDELPEEAEETQVAKFEPRLPVISVTIFGDVDEHSLKSLGQQLRDDLLRLPDITDVEEGGIRKAELSVEIEPEKLVAYQLSLSEVADAIRRTNLDLPAGQIRAPGENVAVRTLGESDQADTIQDTIVRTTPSGRIIRVDDLGQVVDGFVDVDIEGRFNGKPAVDITVYKTSRQDAIDIAARVKAFVAGKLGQPFELDAITRVKNALGFRTAAQQIYDEALRNPYPSELALEVHSNLARYVEDRLDLLERNGLFGLILVFLSLLFFLNWRVALWVMTGLVISLCGTVMLMSFMGVSLNLISMFGMIVVLGLIVDDAIVVGENIYARVELGEDPHVAAVKGAEEVAWPVLVAVCTTIGAFMPLIFIEGRIGDFFGVLPIIVMFALGISLLESLSILPCHLGEWLRPIRQSIHGGGQSMATPGERIVARRRHFLIEMISKRYERLLRRCIHYRYVTVAGLLSAMILSAGMLAGDRVEFQFIQKMDAETLLVNLEMPIGTPLERTSDKLREIESIILDKESFSEIRNVFSLAGAQIQADEGGATASSRSHLAQAIIELETTDKRDRSSDKIINDLRSRTKQLTGMNALRFQEMSGGPAGAEIEIEIAGDDFDAILQAAEVLKTELATFEGVFDIDDDHEDGRREIQLALLDSARPAGFTTQAIATEVRGAFFGIDARTIQRDTEDVDIRVRFPESRRRSIYDLEGMRIKSPSGSMVPLSEVARMSETTGFTSLHRVNQRRAVTVSADVNADVTNADKVLETLRATVNQLEQKFPGTNIQYAGNKLETRKSFGSLGRDFLIAIMLIYVMLAGLFRSYLQPFIVLAAVPFGLIGAVAGHFVMGFPLTIISVIGLVALSGIVVNDSLILVSFINKLVANGESIQNAVVAAGLRRLRPILLTSLTTILGLAPLMAEQSFQAKFLIPMAISISFGLLFATVLTLIVVPAFYMILQDVYRIGRIFRPGAAPRPTPTQV